MSLWAWIVGVVADDGDADVAAASVTLTVEAPVTVSLWSTCRWHCCIVAPSPSTRPP